MRRKEKVPCDRVGHGGGEEDGGECGGGGAEGAELGGVHGEAVGFHGVQDGLRVWPVRSPRLGDRQGP